VIADLERRAEHFQRALHYQQNRWLRSRGEPTAA